MTSGAKCTVISPAEENRVILTLKGQSYVLRFQRSQLVLDITEAKTDTGTNAQQWEYNGDVSQQFQLTKTADGIYAILYHGNMALTVDESDGKVIITEYSASDQQLWLMEKQ